MSNPITREDGLANIEAWWKAIQENRHTIDDPLLDEDVCLGLGAARVTAGDLRAVFNGAQPDHKARLDAAYAQRNAMAILMAKMALSLGWTAGWALDADKPTWDDGWKVVVHVDFPYGGQISYHMAPSEGRRAKELLPEYTGQWDGEFLSRSPHGMLGVFEGGSEGKHINLVALQKDAELAARMSPMNKQSMTGSAYLATLPVPAADGAAASWQPSTASFLEPLASAPAAAPTPVTKSHLRDTMIDKLVEVKDIQDAAWTRDLIFRIAGVQKMSDIPDDKVQAVIDACEIKLAEANPRLMADNDARNFDPGNQDEHVDEDIDREHPEEIDPTDPRDQGAQ